MERCRLRLYASPDRQWAELQHRAWVACSLVAVSDPLQPHGLYPARLLCPWKRILGKNTRVGCYFLLWGIFPTQGSNPCLLHLLHWQADSLALCHWNIPHYRRGLGFSQGGHTCSAQAPDPAVLGIASPHPAHLHCHLELSISSCITSAHPPWAEVLVSPYWTRNSALKGQSQGLCGAAPYEQVRLD